MASSFRASSRWELFGALLGVGIALLMTFSAVTIPARSHAPLGPPTLSERADTNWTLTPPSSWCTRVSSGSGYEEWCNGTGAAWIPLNVTQNSRIVGDLEINGPATLYLLLSVWDCVLAVELSKAFHSCPVPYDPPSRGQWSVNVSAGSTDLATLPIDVYSPIGVLPPATWNLVVVDDQSGNESALVTSPILVEPV